MLKIIIAEDDPAMRLVLKKVLAGIQDVSIAGEAENGRQLVKMVEDVKPDVVFLDIDMPEMNGLQAAQEIFDINPKIFIVFATAYADYALEAFEVYAFDYLVKPFKLDRIKQTVERIKQLIAERENNILLERPVVRQGNDNSRLIIQCDDKLVFVNMEDIIFITRVDRKTVLHTVQGKLINYEPMRNLWERLNKGKFFRCHRGYIVNIDMITEIVPWGNKTYLVKLANTRETALMTLKKARELKEMFGMS